MQRMFGAIALSLCATTAWASSEASWAELDAAASKACMANITKRYSRDPTAAFGVMGHISGIGGATGDANYALLIQRNARNGKDTWICLYDKVTKIISVGLVSMTPQ